MHYYAYRGKFNSFGNKKGTISYNKERKFSNPSLLFSHTYYQSTEKFICITGNLVDLIELKKPTILYFILF